MKMNSALLVCQHAPPNLIIFNENDYFMQVIEQENQEFLRILLTPIAEDRRESLDDFEKSWRSDKLVPLTPDLTMPIVCFGIRILEKC